MDITPETIGTRMRMARDHAHMKQKEAATHLGISQSTLSTYENGLSDASISMGIKMARLYNVSLKWILCLSDSIGTVEPELSD